MRVDRGEEVRTRLVEEELEEGRFVGPWRGDWVRRRFKGEAGDEGRECLVDFGVGEERVLETSAGVKLHLGSRGVVGRRAVGRRRGR